MLNAAIGIFRIFNCLRTTAVRAVISVLLLVVVIGTGAFPAWAQELPTLNLERNTITVSGVSSGAYLAVQLHTAFSDRIQGAGIVAGGPFYCAENHSAKALTTCMRPLAAAVPVSVPGLPEPPDGRKLAAIAQQFADEGKLDPTANLKNDKIYLFSGTVDSVVFTPVVDAAQAYYQALGVTRNNIKYVKNVPSGHGFLTSNWGNQCGMSSTPFINDCNYDQAEIILKHLLGKLNKPSTILNGQLIEFDQDKFLRNPNGHGMANKGYVYIPQACTNGENCRLHIALHGCKQSYETIEDGYYAHTGYNQWADSNNIVVLYPQAHALPLKNPNGCWDWWGYTNSQYAFKTGIQTSAIMKMVEAMATG